MDGYPLIFAIVCGLIICILLWKMAHQNHLIGRVIQWVWNISFKIASMIPFCGWMAHFLIADTQQEKANERAHQETGRRIDQAVYDRLGEKAQMELAEQECERKRMEERARLEREISSHLKNQNLPVHIHGNTVDIGDITFSLDDVLSRIDLR